MFLPFSFSHKLQRNYMKKPLPLKPKFEQTDYSEEDTIVLADFMLILARQFKLIIIFPSVLCILMIIYVLFFTKPVYTSIAKIMSSSGGGGSQVTGLAAQFGINIPSAQSEPKWVYPEIVKSRTLARYMLKRKFDTNEFGSQKTLLQILTYGNQESEVGIDTLIKSGLDAAIDMIEIKQSGSFYELTISAHEPVFARDFATAILEELEAHQRKYNKARTSKTRQFIEERIIDVGKELNEAEETLRDFTTRNRRITNSPLLQLEQQRFTREVNVLTGVFTVLKQQLETTKIEEVKEMDYVIVLDPPEVPLQRSKPNKRLMVILAGILGIGLGVFFAFIREFVVNSKKEEKEKMIEAKSLIQKHLWDFIPERLK